MEILNFSSIHWIILINSLRYLVASDNCYVTQPSLNVFDLDTRASIDDDFLEYGPQPDSKGYIFIIKNSAKLKIICESKSRPVDLQVTQESGPVSVNGINRIVRTPDKFRIQFINYEFQNGSSQSTFVCKYVNETCGWRRTLEIRKSIDGKKNKSISRMRMTSANNTETYSTIRRNNCAFQFFLKLNTVSNNFQVNCSYLGKRGILKRSYERNMVGYAPNWEAILRKQMTNSSCLNLLQDTDTCINCHKIDMSNTSYKPMLLKCSYQNYTGQQFAFFPLEMNFDKKETGVYNTWNDMNIEKMIHVNVSNIAVPYQELSISCIFSDFVFAFGYKIQIKRKSLNKPEDLKVKDGYGKYDANLNAQIISHTLLIVPPDLEEVMCLGPIWNSTLYGTSSKTITISEISTPQFDLPIVESYFEVGQFGAELTCSARSNESPNYAWTHHPNSTLINNNKHYKISTSSHAYSSIQFLKVSKDIAGTWSCMAKNSAGSAEKQFRVYINEPSNGFWMWLLIGISFAVIFFVNIFLLVRNRQQKRKSPYYLAKADIEYFLHGSQASDKEYERSSINVEKYYSEIYDKPYNNRFEVPYQYWTIERHNKIGEGKFGHILKGTVTCEDLKVEIAVKIPKLTNSDGPNSTKSVLRELKLLAELEPHPNVVKMVAANTDKIERSKILMGLEYCVYGSIWRYLRKNRDLFYTEIQSDQANSSLHVFPSGIKQLMKWTLEICRGLDFLHAKNRIVHGDIAARNFLLAADMTLKISDFGMATQIPLFGRPASIMEINMRDENQLIPFRWTAPEILKNISITHRTFQSDIWSVGVAIWEIWSLSATPYPAEVYCEEFVAKLEDGLRLQRPELASEELYNIIQQCWEIDYKSRPNSTQAFSEFWKLASKSCENESEYQDVFADD